MSRSKSRRAEDAATFLFLALLSEIRLCIFEIKSDESGSRTQNQAFETAACGKFLFWCCSSAGIRMHRVQLMLHGRANRRTRSRLLPSDAGSKRHGHGVRCGRCPASPGTSSTCRFICLICLVWFTHPVCVTCIRTCSCAHALVQARMRARACTLKCAVVYMYACMHALAFAHTHLLSHLHACSCSYRLKKLRG